MDSHGRKEKEYAHTTEVRAGDRTGGLQCGAGSVSSPPYTLLWETPEAVEESDSVTNGPRPKNRWQQWRTTPWMQLRRGIPCHQQWQSRSRCQIRRRGGGGQAGPASTGGKDVPAGQAKEGGRDGRQQWAGKDKWEREMPGGPGEPEQTAELGWSRRVRISSNRTLSGEGRRAK